MILSLMDLLSEHFPQEFGEALKLTDGMEKLSLLSVLRTYLPMAVIGVVAAFVIYRQIAVKEGRWEIVRTLFVRGKEKKAGIKLFSVPLIIGIGILLVLMVLNEIL